MQIVIDINDEIYKEILNGKDGWSNYVHGLIRTGTPFPKGHGRIIDESKITQVEFETIEEEFEPTLYGTMKYLYRIFKSSDAPTIIEAER